MANVVGKFFQENSFAAKPITSNWAKRDRQNQTSVLSKSQTVKTNHYFEFVGNKFLVISFFGTVEWIWFVYFDAKPIF
jgi:hypothetical protein